MTYAESDLDRALLGQPSKTVEAALRAEKRPKWQTEFDDDLAPLKRTLAIRGGIVALLYVAIQAALIFFVFEPTNVRPQSFNGVTALVIMAGGWIVMLLWMLMPTKRMGYESLKIIRETRQLGVDGAHRTERTFARIEESVTGGLKDMNARLAGIEKGIKDWNAPDPVDYSLLEGEKR